MAEEDDVVSDSDTFEFDFGKYTVISLVGKMGSGKTEAIKSLVYAGFKAGIWKYCVVFCPTKWTGSYDWLPEEARFQFKGKGERVLSIFDKIGKYRAKCAKEGKTPKMIRGCLILDDCAGLSQRLFYQPRWLSAFVTCRHHGPLDIINAVQYFTSLPPAIRNLTTHAILFNTSGYNVVKALYVNFGGGFRTFDEFREAFMRMTAEDHSAMIYVAGQKTVEDSYFGFRFAMAPPFKLSFKLPVSI